MNLHTKIINLKSECESIEEKELEKVNFQRFIMFGSYEKNPRGGWQDVLVRCNDFKFMKESYDMFIKNNSMEWMHVVDLKKKCIILEAIKFNGKIQDITQNPNEYERDKINMRSQ